MSLESSLVWTTSNNKSQIIFVILKISLCKVIAISSHWWLQQWPMRLRCSVSLQLINYLDVWLMKGKGIHFSLIHVGWWKLERERADDDFVICMVLYICISPSLFLFSYFSFVISLLIIIVFLVCLQWLQSKLDIWTLLCLFCSFWNCGYLEFDIVERCVDIFVGKLTNFWYHSLFFKNLRAPIMAEMFNCISW